MAIKHKKLRKSFYRKKTASVNLKKLVKTEWIYGFHAVYAALSNPARSYYQLLALPNAKIHYDNWMQIQEPSVLDKLPIAEIATQIDFDRVLTANASHQGIAVSASILPNIGLEHIIQQSTLSGKAQIIVLDQVTDPQNIGAILRSAYAFQATAVIMQERNAPRNSGALAKTASGALEWIPLIRSINLNRSIQLLKNAGFWVTGLDTAATTTLEETEFGEKAVLVLGSEESGLRRLTIKSCDQMTKIPITRESNSLNISNAGAIALYELSKKTA